MWFQNRPFLATHGSAFLKVRRTTSASTKLPLDESQNSSHNQNLKVRHEVACAEWSKGSRSCIQDCPQSLSASLVTVVWKARGHAQGNFKPNEATGLEENWKDEGD